MTIFEDPADPLKKVDDVAPAKTDEAALAQLMTIVKEDGTAKYATLEEGIKALANSQAYIPTLQSQLDAKDAELAALKAKQESSESVEEVVAKLLAERETEKKPTDTQVPKGLDEASVAELIRKENARAAIEAQSKANEESVAKVLTDKFGDKTQEEVAKRAVELGLTPEKLGQLAKESPQMVLSLFNTVANPAAQPTSSSINTSGFQTSEKKELEKPPKSLLSGATSGEQAEYMKKIKEDVYAKFGVES